MRDTENIDTVVLLYHGYYTLRNGIGSSVKLTPFRVTILVCPEVDFLGAEPTSGHYSRITKRLSYRLYISRKTAGTVEYLDVVT